MNSISLQKEHLINEYEDVLSNKIPSPEVKASFFDIEMEVGFFKSCFEEALKRRKWVTTRLVFLGMEAKESNFSAITKDSSLYILQLKAKIEDLSFEAFNQHVKNDIYFTLISKKFWSFGVQPMSPRSATFRILQIDIVKGKILMNDNFRCCVHSASNISDWKFDDVVARVNNVGHSQVEYPYILKNLTKDNCALVMTKRFSGIL